MFSNLHCIYHFRKSYCKWLVVIVVSVHNTGKCFDTKKICICFITTIYRTRTSASADMCLSLMLTEPRGWYHFHQCVCLKPMHGGCHYLQILRLGIKNCAHSPHGRKKSSSAKFSTVPECCVTPLTTKQTTYTCLKPNVSAAVCFWLVVDIVSR